MGKYVSEKGADAIKEYKYAGADNSYIYIYLLTPMNKFLINFFPMWMAPNVITISGFCVMISAHIITLYYCANFKDPMPPWVYIYVGVSLFVYQTLDNLDGRQARRTGASSPLGLLFDHGVDAANVTCATLAQLCVFQIDNAADLYILWVYAYVPFFIATWDEYYTGELILPAINGPSDGVILCIFFCFFQPMFGVGFWARSLVQNFPFLAGTSYASYPTSKAILLAGFIAVTLTIVNNVKTVYNFRRSKGKGLGDPLYRMMPFLCQLIMGYLLVHYSPSQIFHKHPRIFFIGMGFLFCNMVCKLMLANLTKESYNPLRKVLLPLIAVTFNSMSPYLFSSITEPPVDEFYALCAASIWGFLCWMDFVVSVINELTNILDIYCFTIKQKPAPTRVNGMKNE